MGLNRIYFIQEPPQDPQEQFRDQLTRTLLLPVVQRQVNSYVVSKSPPGPQLKVAIENYFLTLFYYWFLHVLVKKSYIESTPQFETGQFFSLNTQIK